MSDRIFSKVINLPPGTEQGVRLEVQFPDEDTIKIMAMTGPTGCFVSRFDNVRDPAQLGPQIVEALIAARDSGYRDAKVKLKRWLEFCT